MATRWEALITRSRPFWRLARLDDPLDLAVLSWPVLWVLWHPSAGAPAPGLGAAVVLAWLLARSGLAAAMSLLEGRLPVSRPRALAFAAALLAAAALMLFLLDPRALIPAVVGASLIAMYPLLRLHSHLAQLVLALGYGVIAPTVYLAMGAGLPRQAWLLSVALTLWAAAYGTALAALRRGEDIERGYKSTALLFGDGTWALVGILQALMFMAFLLLGGEPHLHAWYYGAVLVAITVSAWGVAGLRGVAPGGGRVASAQGLAGAVLLIGMF